MCAVRHPNPDGSARRRLRKKLTVIDGYRSAVRKINFEWLEAVWVKRLLWARAPGTRSAISTRFQAGDQKEVDDFNGIRIHRNADRPPTGCDREEFGMVNRD